MVHVMSEAQGSQRNMSKPPHPPREQWKSCSGPCYGKMKAGAVKCTAFKVSWLCCWEPLAYPIGDADLFAKLQTSLAVEMT